MGKSAVRCGLEQAFPMINAILVLIQAFDRLLFVVSISPAYYFYIQRSPIFTIFILYRIIRYYIQRFMKGAIANVKIIPRKNVFKPV